MELIVQVIIYIVRCTLFFLCVHCTFTALVYHVLCKCSTVFSVKMQCEQQSFTWHINVCRNALLYVETLFFNFFTILFQYQKDKANKELLDSCLQKIK